MWRQEEEAAVEEDFLAAGEVAEAGEAGEKYGNPLYPTRQERPADMAFDGRFSGDRCCGRIFHQLVLAEPGVSIYRTGDRIGDECHQLLVFG